MTLPFTGGCACGAVRYECTTEPVMALNCHCRDGQRASGSAYASGVFVPGPALRVTKGEPKFHNVTTGSGSLASRGFCPDCGCPVFAKNSAHPMFIVYAASLDDPSWHNPTMDIWASSAQPWDHLDANRLRYDRGFDS